MVEYEDDYLRRQLSSLSRGPERGSADSSDTRARSQIPEAKKPDAVNHPSHYTRGGVECIDAIKSALGDSFPDFCAGQVMKYVWRYKHKNGSEDLRKAQWYLNKLIEDTK